jgi:hypothetical protein
VAASVRERARARRLLLALAGASAVALMLLLDLWRCPLAELAGVPCPGCGLTRAAFALALGDVPRALELHPLAPLVLPWVALAAAGALLRSAPGVSVALDAPRARLRVALSRAVDGSAPLLLALLVGVWLARFFGAFGGPVPVSSHLLGWTVRAAGGCFNLACNVGEVIQAAPRPTVL